MIDTSVSLAFSVYENPGVYALLIGSGVSRAAQIPTGWEVTLDLVKRVAALQGVDEQTDWAEWHRTNYGKDPSYSDLLDQLAQTPDERRSILHSYIEPTPADFAEGKKIPTKAHHAIARLVQAGFVRIIITTNFDRLLENALREVGVEPVVVKSDDDLKGVVPLIHGKCFIVKVHGDYLDTRIRNTETELSSYSTDLNAFINRIIDEHGLIICGWSGDWDPALKAAITRAPNRRYPLFWASRGKPSEGAAALIAQRGGRTIPIDTADTFFEKLERSVSLQVETQRSNPRSIELLVAGAKKYLSKSEFRIQLNDLIAEETRQLIGGTEGEGFDASGNLTPDIFAKRIGRYEASSEPLVRILSILGRWGDGKEFDIAIELIGRFARQGSGSGLVILLGLKSYPAVLLFYGYALGLLKAKRFSDLYRLFSAPLYNSSINENEPLVRMLFLGAWKGASEAGWWKSLPGFDRRKTALSDHLHDIFKAWSKDIVIEADELTLLYEEFEFLAAIAYITLEEKDLGSLKERGKPDGYGRSFVWAPTGRVGWDSETRRVVLNGFAEPARQKAILAAGFAHNSSEFWDETLAQLGRLYDGMRF